MQPTPEAVLIWMVQFGMNCLGLLYRVRALQMNMYSYEVPTEKKREINDHDRGVVLKLRAEVPSEELWLWPDGPRDAICAALELVPQQVAKILADQTKADNGGRDPESGSEVSAADPPSGAGDAGNNDPPEITADPSTWPERELEPGVGDRGELPKRIAKGKYHNKPDDIDWLILQLIHNELVEEDSSPRSLWNLQRIKMALCRRLTPQQIAGMVTKLGGIPKPSA